MSAAAGTPGRSGPLEQVTSIKLKLGLLVAASVLVAAVLATVGAGTVPALLGIPVTVLVALAVTQLLAIGMTSPLRQMTEAARRMAAGDYDVRVVATSTDEVGELARAFNRMAADLATVDRQRRELVATVSHELRTPLAALVAVLENLDDRVTEPDPETIRVALGQAQRLGDLVRDLLDLSRVEAGVVPLERRSVPVAALLGEVVAEVEASHRGVRFEVRVDPPSLEIDADPRRLHQLLANLLDNAVRHSPAGGVVRIWAGRVSGVPRIEVADEGPGIAPDDRERVFERFGTLSDPAGGGTGLGLAIARWVTDLHGGRVALVDPLPGETGARFRVELPAPTTREERAPMSTMDLPAHPPAAPRVSPPGSLVDDSFGSFWPDHGVPPRTRVLLACIGIGVFAGLTLPFERLGLAAALVLLASGALVLTVSRWRGERFTWACAALAVAFAVVVVVRDAAWVAVLGVMVSGVLVTSALVRARTFNGMLLGGLAWAGAGLRGMPWLGRTLRAFGGGARSVAVLRTTVLSVLALLVFGGLFASGDAIVGHWASLVLPDLGSTLVLRAFLAVAIGGVVLAAAYLAINPPSVDVRREHRPAAHRFEWLAPVLLVDAVFAVFLAAQATAFFGGHDYVQSITGLTYADYVHQGFTQLTLATMLTLLVVWAAARKVAESGPDRAWLRASLGVLCVLTLVVVASALHRMDLYQQAYGFSRLRLLVDAFEGWLGLVVVGVLVAGIGLRGSWLPRMALLSGATVLLGLAVINPDAWIAQHNLDRYASTGRIDWSYLEGLSADAAPVFADRAPQLAQCVGSSWGEADSWAAFNLSRHRARHDFVRRFYDPGEGVVCP